MLIIVVALIKYPPLSFVMLVTVLKTSLEIYFVSNKPLSVLKNPINFRFLGVRGSVNV